MKLISDCALRLLAEILSEEALIDPSKLLRFLLLTFADLKAYRFTYWMAMPAVIPDESNAFQQLHMENLIDWNASSTTTTISSISSSNISGRQISSSVYKSMAEYVAASRLALPPVFVLQVQHADGAASSTHLRIISLRDAFSSDSLWQQQSNSFIVLFDSNNTDTGFSWIVRNLLMALSLLIKPSAGSDFTANIIGLRGSTPFRMLR